MLWSSIIKWTESPNDSMGMRNGCHLTPWRWKTTPSSPISSWTTLRHMGCTYQAWRADLKLLSINCSTHKVYNDCCTTIAVTSHCTVSLVTFHRMWREIVLFIVTMCPATDLCWFWQKYQQKISEAANKSDEEKARLHDIASEHLGCVSKERAFYQDICKKTKDTLPAAWTLVAMIRAATMVWCTTAWISHSMCTTHLTPCSPDQYISRRPGHVQFSVLPVRHCQSKWHFS